MMKKQSSIDVVTRPSIILPAGVLSEVDRIERVLKNSEEKSSENAAVNNNPGDDIKSHTKIDSGREKTLFEKYKERQNSDSVGWVQEHEVEIAKKHIRECLGFDPLPMCGYQMAVVVFEDTFARDNKGQQTSLVLSDYSRDEAKFRNPTGLVVAQGADCYMSSRFREHWFVRTMRVFFNPIMKKPTKKPWCRVGDWVVFCRNSAKTTIINYRGYPTFLMYDDNIYSPVEDPSYITRDFV